MSEPARRHPEWIKVRAPGSDAYQATADVLQAHGIVTVCREAVCPNQAECWQDRTATFMIGGSICTRGCRFCGVATAKAPPAPDPTEPQRVAAAARDLGIDFVVLTSVDRDDLPDGGAGHWVATVRAVRQEISGVRLECLVPDFKGERAPLERIIAERPEVISHNLETVPRLYKRIRPGARVDWSLDVLTRIADAGLIAKTGLMVGLGETRDEILEFCVRARDVGVKVITIGQYLRPGRRHAPVERYWHPDEFELLGQKIRDLGVPVVEAGPFVRSSYHAHRHADALLKTAAN